jgi:hypothetical protein
MKDLEAFEKTITDTSSKAYLDYIKKHIENINRVWGYISKNSPYSGNTEFVAKLNDEVEHHDDSKLESVEFDGYRQWFYPSSTNPDEKNKLKFDLAWNHHQKSNPHHWEYWVMQDGTVLPMDKINLEHMLIDWSAMSLYFDDTPEIFYNKYKDTIVLHDESRQYIEDNLERYVLAVKELKK